MKTYLKGSACGFSTDFYFLDQWRRLVLGRHYGYFARRIGYGYGV